MRTLSRIERGGSIRSALTACASSPTSATDSSQLLHVFKCSSTARCSSFGSSPVRSASTRVSVGLHRIRDPLFLQRLPQQFERPEHLPTQRRLGSPDGLDDFSVRHFFHE